MRACNRRRTRRICLISTVAAELRFHRPARLDGFIVGIYLDVAPAHHGAMGDGVLQLDPVARRFPATHRRKGSQPPASICPHGITTLAIQKLAGAQGALGDRHGVTAKSRGCPVGSPRNAAERIEMFNSSPIR